jgi:hypothetical protein
VSHKLLSQAHLEELRIQDSNHSVVYVSRHLSHCSLEEAAP